MKTYREHNEAVQVLVTVTGQTLDQRQIRHRSHDHGVMTECSTPEHVSGVTTKLGSHQKEIEKDRQTGSGDRADSQSMAL